MATSLSPRLCRHKSLGSKRASLQHKIKRRSFPLVYGSGWRPSHSAEAGRYVLSGLWKAVRPPPGCPILAAASSIARLAASWCCSGCCFGFRRRRSKDEAKAALKRLGWGGLGVGLGVRDGVGQAPPAAASKTRTKAKETGVGKKGRLAALARSGHFWCFKVHAACTAHVGGGGFHIVVRGKAGRG